MEMYLTHPSFVHMRASHEFADIVGCHERSWPRCLALASVLSEVVRSWALGFGCKRCCWVSAGMCSWRLPDSAVLSVRI